MMRRALLAPLVAAFTLMLAGCGGGVTHYDTARDIADALDNAGLKVSTLHETTDEGFLGEIGGRSYDVKIDMSESAINMFPNSEALKQWVSLSKGFGGIAVVGDTWAVSLPSGDDPGESRPATEELAPRLADALGGEVEK